MTFENFAIGLAEKMKRNKVERSDGTVEEIFEYDKNKKYKSTKEIIFTDKKGNKINLAEFLPKDWKFNSGIKSGLQTSDKPKQYFCINCNERKINYGKLDKNGRLFTLLHEIGHAHNIIKNPDQEDSAEEFDAYTHSINNQKITVEDIKNRCENPDNYIPANLLRVKDGQDYYIKVLVPKEIVDKYAQLGAQSGRNASAYAMKIINDLRKRGIEIEGDMSREDLHNMYYNVLDFGKKDFAKDYGLETDYFTKNINFKKIENIEKNYFD